MWMKIILWTLKMVQCGCGTVVRGSETEPSLCFANRLEGL